jgi:hypothetical protein
VRSDLNRKLQELGMKQIDIFDKDLLDMYMRVQKYFNNNPKYWAMTGKGLVKQLSMDPVDLSSPTISVQGSYVVDAI